MLTPISGSILLMREKQGEGIKERGGGNKGGETYAMGGGHVRTRKVRNEGRTHSHVHACTRPRTHTHAYQGRGGREREGKRPQRFSRSCGRHHKVSYGPIALITEELLLQKPIS